MDFIQDFIQIERIVKNKKGVQEVKPEVICVSEIHTFRPWYPGQFDTWKGDATLLVMKSVSRVTGDQEESEENDKNKNDKNLPTLVIHEKFTNFIKRMSGRVILIGDAR